MATGDRHLRIARFPSRAATGLAALLVCAATADAATARFAGVVWDAVGHGLSGVAVVLYPSGGGAPVLATSGESGEFEFQLASGSYAPVFSKQGYREYVHSTIELEDGETLRVLVELGLAYSVDLTVEQRLDERFSGDPGDMREFTNHHLDLLRLPTDRFQETLPLLPGVVRDPRGRLSFNGARPSQSMLLVNGSNVTDPLTGEFAVELPIKAIEAVQVYTLPYSAEYGRVTGAVANVITRSGDDDWDVEVGGVVPSPRFRGLKPGGINSATPHIQVSGPLRKQKVWISQGLAYRFVRSRVFDLPAGEDAAVLENFDSFTQINARLGEAHSVSTTFSLFPVEVDNFGIDTLHPAEASPDFESHGWHLAMGHRFTASPSTLIDSTFALKSFDVAVRPEDDSLTRLTVDGLRDNYFNEIDRNSRRWEANLVVSHFVREARGAHLLKVGANVSHTRFDGVDRSQSIAVVGADESLLRTVEFEGDGMLEASDLEVAAFVQDEWRPSSRLGIDFGLRYDFERITGDHHVSPRVAFAFSVVPDGATILKGGWGRFYDKVLLHSGSFEHFQRRLETVYGADGGLDRLVFQNRLAEEGLRVPRSTMWNLEVDQALGAGLLLRVNYRERRGSKELVVDRLEHTADGPVLLLSSRGQSDTREFDVTLRKSLGEDDELFLSWAKIRSSTDLNDFGTLYGNLRDPLVLESEQSLQPHDVPSRVLLWGHVNLPWKLQVSPALEWRRGFPYTVFNEDYSPASERNRGGRFPSFFSIDFRITRAVTIFGKQTRIGLQGFNLTNHFNPRDVQANLASPRFGEFANSVGFSVGLRFQMGL